MKFLSKLFKSNTKIMTPLVSKDVVATHEQLTQEELIKHQKEMDDYVESLRNININSIDTNKIKYMFNKGKVRIGDYDDIYTFYDYRNINPAYYKKFLKIKSKLNKLDEVDEVVAHTVENVFYIVKNFYDYGIVSYDENDDIYELEVLINYIAHRINVKGLPLDKLKREQVKRGV